MNDKKQQKIVRTSSDATPDNLNKHLSEGWFLISVMPIGKFLEYVIQKA